MDPMLYHVLKLHVMVTLLCSKKNKNLNQALDLCSLPVLFQIYSSFRVCKQNFYFLFLNLSALFCLLTQKLADVWLTSRKHSLEIKERRGGGIKLFYKQRAWYYSGDKIKYRGYTPFKTMLIFVKFAVKLIAL